MTHLGKSRHVRALIDTGSQKSYILKATAKFLGYQSKGKISLVHGLFGGSNLMQNHDCYDVELNHDTYSCTFEALDQAVICNSVSSIFDGPWTEELRKLNIEISDSYDSTPIELLIGSDIAGKLYTGRRHILNCNLVAIETLLGWTLMGKIPVETHSNLAMISLSLFVNNAPITNLWELDVLGIKDPMERKTRDETALAAKKLFLETISVDTDGRYEVRLPWLEGHPALPSNYHLAKSRLDNTAKKITKDGYFEAYDQVFQEWLNDNIIEEVVEEQRNQEAHYLPHRPVIKPSSITTKIRPVFDASAREKDSPSLNQCLEKGVVFGINSSPFLLGASLEYHLSKLVDEYDSKASFTTDTVKKLSNSFYVDNCVTSVASEIELKTFIKEANMIMAKGKFDLRGWEFTHQVQNDSFNIFTVVLGIKWNKLDDTLSINQDDEDIEQILSKSKTWEKQLGWDTPVDEELETLFRSWIKQLSYLNAIKIPRWINAGTEEAEHWTFHTFCDASKEASSAVVFLRGIRDGGVFLHLLAAKSRVAPIKKLSIPRLELMAAVIGVRLYTTVKESLNIEMESFFWSDSTTVLSWIRRPEEWSTFVWNRVSEIRKLSHGENWHHVPGRLNPADLPSRGCSAKQILESRWWEGPQWLYQDLAIDPQVDLDYNEDEINQERKVKLVATLINDEHSKMSLDDWHFGYFSQYLKTLRMCAWIFRFLHNSRNKDRLRGHLCSEEIDRAEIFVLRIVQKESFCDKNDKLLCGMDVYKDDDDLIRLKSRISNRSDCKSFLFPIVLPAKHFLVNQLIFREHLKSCHSRTQGLMSRLRQNYWILGGRRTIKSAISNCVVCKRQNAKPFIVSAPPLPVDRVRDANAFEITGVDFAGPLYLRTGEKVWVCLFTCAVYRAVHLELCTALSVVSFMQALRRFIARRGRPKTIYSDNGTNFVGTENAFLRVDFEKIAESSSVEHIQWRFNPPTAAWWGGFWERLVGGLKQLLRKVLGQASLDYESLMTVICDCEAIINSRPLTSSNDPNDLIPLTPMMFLRDQTESGVPDCDAVDQKALSRKVVYRQKLVDDLRRRFRNEYLGQLKLWFKGRSSQQVKVGDMVLVGNDQDKRINWPLGRVVELLPGKDKQVRLVRVNTERGQFLRPVQRLYPLECTVNSIRREGNSNNLDSEGNNDPGISSRAQWKEVEVRAVESANECDDTKTGVSKSRVPETHKSDTRYVTRSGRKIKTSARYTDFFMN
ncbi:uncharacterized protein [Diabrotica undecimpunctata]|uniref:uncharacterized protein n=1 Tax=Diabrotica undecimpunctata TaxID=50387 RepID=UPI003B632DE6